MSEPNAVAREILKMWIGPRVHFPTPYRGGNFRNLVKFLPPAKKNLPQVAEAAFPRFA